MNINMNIPMNKQARIKAKPILRNSYVPKNKRSPVASTAGQVNTSQLYGRQLSAPITNQINQVTSPPLVTNMTSPANVQVALQNQVLTPF